VTHLSKLEQRALLAHRDVPYEPVPAATVAEWPPGTFAENLAPGPDGSWLVSLLSHNRIDQVHRDGSITVLATLPVMPFGITTLHDDAYVVAGSIGQDNWRLYRISLARPGAELVGKLPELRLGNGMAVAGQYLMVVDSIQGNVTAVSPYSGETTIWLESDLLRSAYPELGLPGVNGIVVADGVIYLTNTSRSLLLSVPVLAGDLNIVANEIIGDDFARHPDGSFYVATHLHDSVVHIKPDGTRRDIARGLDNATAVAVDPADPDYVLVTVAGEDLGTQGGTTPARLVRLQVNG
jgi:hypothetical protein